LVSVQQQSVFISVQPFTQFCAAGIKTNKQSAKVKKKEEKNYFWFQHRVVKKEY
jgi:hypothetical protein